MTESLLIIHIERTDYSPRDVENTMTIAELVEYLENAAAEIGSDAPVTTCCDRYTYGAVRADNIEGYEDWYTA